MDNGVTRIVCGEAVLNSYLIMHGMEIEISKDPRDFRFGDGIMIQSQFCTRTRVCVGKVWRESVIYVLPGQIPLLLARSDLESWNIMVNYGKKLVYVDAVEVKSIIFSNGNYII